MTRSDVIILGGGLIGLALAAALDASGLKSVVVDPVDPDSWKDSKFEQLDASSHLPSTGAQTSRSYVLALPKLVSPLQRSKRR